MVTAPNYFAMDADAAVTAPNCFATEANAAETVPNCFAMEADATVTDHNWRAPLLAYLVDEVLAPDRIEARTIARLAKTFVTIDGELYK